MCVWVSARRGGDGGEDEEGLMYEAVMVDIQTSRHSCQKMRKNMRKGTKLRQRRRAASENRLPKIKKEERKDKM